MMTLHAPSAIPLAATLMLAVGSAVAAPQPAQESATVSDPENEPARVAVDGAGARLEVAFDLGPDSQLAVRYRVNNTGDAAIAVFDRGDRQAVLAKTLKAGDVPPPQSEQSGADLELRHAARPLPSPSPTVPPTPMAARVVPGGIVEGAFPYDLTLARGVERVRWCVGVGPFAEADFGDPQQLDEREVWRASFAAVDTQQMLCTPWYTVATRSFDGT